MNDLILTAISTAILVVSGFVANALYKLADAKRAEADLTKADLIAAEIADATGDAVRMTFQTYVDSLKASGSFDEDAQEKAFSMALSALLSSLSQSAKDYISDNYGDITDYLTTKIEAEVKSQKLLAA